MCITRKQFYLPNSAQSDLIDTCQMETMINCSKIIFPLLTVHWTDVFDNVIPNWILPLKIISWGHFGNQYVILSYNKIGPKSIHTTQSLLSALWGLFNEYSILHMSWINLIVTNNWFGHQFYVPLVWRSKNVHAKKEKLLKTNHKVVCVINSVWFNRYAALYTL